MTKIFRTSIFYMIFGLVAGVFFREFTKLNNFTGNTQLSSVHPHLLVLGMIFFLIVLILAKNFDITNDKKFNKFYIFYNMGLLITAIMMLIHGTLTVLGYSNSPAISGIAGLGHIILTVGLIFFFITLSKAIHKSV